MILRRTAVLAAFAAAAASFAAPVSAEDTAPLRFSDLYSQGVEFSEKAQNLNGQTVEMAGFMAPPLKPDADFFVLTVVPMAACPFCDDAMDWPRDIALVKLDRRPERWLRFDRPIAVTGTLELGTEIDEETGFVSRVRLVDAAFELRVRQR